MLERCSVEGLARGTMAQLRRQRFLSANLEFDSGTMAFSFVFCLEAVVVVVDFVRCSVLPPLGLVYIFLLLVRCSLLIRHVSKAHASTRLGRTEIEARFQGHGERCGEPASSCSCKDRKSSTGHGKSKYETKKKGTRNRMDDLPCIPNAT